MIELLSL